VYRVGNGGEIVIGQHQIGRFACGIRAFFAHGDANISSFECGRIVDAIARHGYQMSLCLQRRNQTQFVFRTGARKDIGFLRADTQLRVV